MKNLMWILVIGASVSLAACSQFKSSAPPLCVAGPNEKCPDDETVRIAVQVKEMQDDLSSPELQKKVALLNGYQQMLGQHRPGPNYSYDLKAGKWVAPAPPPPPPPAPAAEPAKK